MGDDFHIQWHITNRCGVRCAHCYQDEFTSASDMSFSEVELVRENIRRFLQRNRRRLTVNLTGGEPFLSPWWRQLLERLLDDELVAETGVITSGLCFTREILAFLSSAKRVFVKVSAEGFSQDGYERFRGSGTWKQFLAGLDGLAAEHLPVTLMFTLLETNAGELERMLSFAEEHGIAECIVERFIPWGNGRRLANQVVSSKRWAEACGFLMDACGCEPDLAAVAPYRAFLVRRRGAHLTLLGAPCVVGRDGIALMPDATVFPCRRFPLALGNLGRDELDGIWRLSPVLALLRDRSRLKGACGRCRVAECAGCRALAYAMTGDFLAEDPLCLCAGCGDGVE